MVRGRRPLPTPSPAAEHYTSLMFLFGNARSAQLMAMRFYKYYVVEFFYFPDNLPCTYLPVVTSQSLIVRSRACVSSDTNVPPAGSNRRLVTGAAWPSSVHRQLPVVRSQMHMRPFSWPLNTQPSWDDMSNATQSTPGFHFLNSVPDCKSYTTMKLGPASSTSCAWPKTNINIKYNEFSILYYYVL